MNKQALSKAVMLILFAACGVYLGYYGAPAIDLLNAPDQPSILQFLIIAALLLGLAGSILLQFIIHEAGHLVFGLLSGYRFASFRIGNLMLIRQNGRIRLRRLSLPGTGGQCLLIPPDLKNGRLPVVCYLMGNAILNLVSVPFFWSFHVLSRGLNRSILVTELAFRELIGLNRQEVLDPLFTKEFKLYLKSMARYPAAIRLQYAHALLAKRDTAEADKWLAIFEKAAKTYPYPCDIESEREILAVVHKIGLERF